MTGSIRSGMVGVNVSARERFLIPLGMYLREYYRNTLNLVLLAVIPVLLILSFGDALSRAGELLGVVTTPDMGKAMGALWAAAFLSGIMGFFMMAGAREADRRLVRAGYGTSQVVMIRLTTVALLGAVATTVSYLVLIAQLSPESYGLTFAALYLAAITYGAVGILIGSLIPGELEGSFAMLFFFIMDAFVGSPLFGSASNAFAFLPTFYPTKILAAMVVGGPHDAIHWLYATLYAVTIVVLASVAFYRAARLR